MANHQLASKVITTALTGDAIYTSPVYRVIQPILSVLLHCAFNYGSAGTSADIYVQTSLDGGVTWIDVAEFSFTTSNANKVVNLSALTPVTTAYTPTEGAMSANTVKDGILGDLWRVVMKSSGTYATNTNVKVNASFKTSLVG